jgi:hypothetical protein
VNVTARAGHALVRDTYATVRRATLQANAPILRAMTRDTFVDTRAGAPW